MAPTMQIKEDHFDKFEDSDQARRAEGYERNLTEFEEE